MLYSLTSLRFFCALLVVFHHGEWAFHQSGLSGFYDFVISHGYAGVSFFFVLSGFVLSHSSSRGITRNWDFYRRRFQRVYPTHALMLFAAFPLALHDNPGVALLVSSFIFNGALLHAWIPINAFYFSFDSPSWSLSVELLFYLLFPALIRASSKQLAAVAAAGVLLPYVIAPSSGVADHFAFYIFPPSRLAEFCVGVICFRIARCWCPRREIVGTLLEILCICSILGTLLIAHTLPFRVTASLLFFPVFAGTIMVYSWQTGLLSHVLKSRLFVILGEASFSLYLIHQLVFRYWRWVSTVWPFWQPAPIVMFLICGSLSVVLSIVMFVYFERPLLATLRKERARPTTSCRQISEAPPSAGNA